jgi:hypothetical protein
MASANRQASTSAPSLAPSVNCDTKQTIDPGDSIIGANPPLPLVSYENALQLLAAHHAKKKANGIKKYQTRQTNFYTQRRKLQNSSALVIC